MEKRLQQYGQFFYTSPHHSTEFSDEIESSSRLFQRNAIYNSSLIASDDDEQLFFEINPPPFFGGGGILGNGGREKRGWIVCGFLKGSSVNLEIYFAWVTLMIYDQYRRSIY